MSFPPLGFAQYYIYSEINELSLLKKEKRKEKGKKKSNEFLKKHIMSSFTVSINIF